MKKHITLVSIVCCLVILSVAVTGCKKKSEQPAVPKQTLKEAAAATKATAESATKTAESATKTAETAKKTADTAAAKVTVAVEQTTCPVLAGPINKDIFVEYQGQKVYFCCADCKEKFLKEPTKYLANLPQFKK